MNYMIIVAGVACLSPIPWIVTSIRDRLRRNKQAIAGEWSQCYYLALKMLDAYERSAMANPSTASGRSCLRQWRSEAKAWLAVSAAGSKHRQSTWAMNQYAYGYATHEKTKPGEVLPIFEDYNFA